MTILFRFVCLTALLVVGCSESSSPSTTPDATTQSDADMRMDAMPEDAHVDAIEVDGNTSVETYADAVRAASWEALPQAPMLTRGRKLDDGFFLDGQRGFVASGPSFSLLKTEDGGASWANVVTQQGTFFRSLAFLNDTHGFAGNFGAGLSPSISDEDVIYETKDSGATWTPVSNIEGPAPAGICNFDIVDESTIVAVGRANRPAHLLISTDSGAKWVSHDLGEHLMMAIDARFTSATEGIVAGMGNDQKCTIIRTEDGGASFTKVFSSSTMNSMCWKLDFPSDEVGYTAIQDGPVGPGTFGKTTDGGKTWTELPLPTSEAYAAIGVGFVTENIGWMAPNRSTGTVYRTFDGGTTWEEEPNLKGPINRFRVIDRNTVYAIGGTVWKLEVEFND